MQVLCFVVAFQVALWTLGQMIESTGCVIEPYRKYPSLLDVLVNYLRTETSHSIRREAIRVIGAMTSHDTTKCSLSVLNYFMTKF